MRSKARQRLALTQCTFYFMFLCQGSADSKSLSLRRGFWDNHSSQRCVQGRVSGVFWLCALTPIFSLGTRSLSRCMTRLLHATEQEE